MKKFIAIICFIFYGCFMASAQIVMTEIMYNPPESGTDSLEYVELYNRGNAAVDISGWNFTQGFVFVFPAGTSMAPGSYAIICKSTAFFKARFNTSVPVFQFDGALTNSPGEDIELRDAAGAVMDYVDYMNLPPWPAGTNGQGASLVLCDVATDNSLAASWAAATTKTGVIINSIEVLANPGAASNCSGTPPVTTYPVRTIAQMTTENVEGVADSVAKICELNGIVYGVNLRGATGVQFTLMDETGNNGIMVFNGVKNFGYTVTEKDKVTIRGRIEQFRGLTQINIDTLFKGTSNNALVAPATVTKLGENTESRLVRLANLTLVDPAAWTTGVGVGGFTVRALAPGIPDTIDIRIDNDVDLYNLPVPPQPFTLTGIGGQFDATSPLTSGYQILPRYKNDISTLVRTKEADFSADVTISPNPSAQMIHIQSNLTFDRVRIYAPTGQLVYATEVPFSAQQIDMRTFASGTYLLQLEKGGAVWTTKVVKI